MTQILLIFVTALTFSILGTPIARRLALHAGVVDALRQFARCLPASADLESDEWVKAAFDRAHVARTRWRSASSAGPATSQK